MRPALVTASLILLTSNATLTRAAVISGSGSLTSAGDKIVDTMLVDGLTVGYTLELLAADLDGSIDWNGAGSSVPFGLSWADGQAGGAHWSIALKIDTYLWMEFGQVGPIGESNEPESVFSVEVDGTIRIAAIADVRDDPLTGAVNGSSGGTATVSSLNRIANGLLTWRIFTQSHRNTFLLRWENPTDVVQGIDSFGILANTLRAPEPSTALMLAMAILTAAVWMRERSGAGDR